MESNAHIQVAERRDPSLASGPSRPLVHLFKTDRNRYAYDTNTNRILTVSKDRTVKLWSVQSGSCLTTLRVDGPLSSCAWFPDGQQIVVVGSRGVYFLRLMR